MPDEILIPPGKGLLKILEYYCLACIGQLPAERERKLRQRVKQTYGGGPDWKVTLREALRLDPGAEALLRQRWQTEQERACRSGANPDPETFVRSLLEELFPEQARPKSLAIPKYRQTGPVVLKAIGFWRDDHGIFVNFPQPQRLVRRGWHADDREQILTYLRSGFACAIFCGWSSCRFGCAPGNGCSDFTDGEWLWPEGLAHYIECHDLILPEEFVQTMRVNHWQVPDVADLVPPAMWQRDFTFWLEWAATHGRQGFW